jgi:hypothetical protein
MEFEKVQFFTYPGSVVNQNNEIREIKEIINAGTKTFYAKKKMFQCNYYLMEQNLDYTGQQSYQSLHEAWVLQDSTVRKLMEF